MERVDKILEKISDEKRTIDEPSRIQQITGVLKDLYLGVKVRRND